MAAALLHECVPRERPRRDGVGGPEEGGARPGGNCIKIGLPGKSILGYYFQENRTPRRPFLLLKISFPGRPIFIQFIPVLREGDVGLYPGDPPLDSDLVPELPADVVVVEGRFALCLVVPVILEALHGDLMKIGKISVDHTWLDSIRHLMEN